MQISEQMISIYRCRLICWDRTAILGIVPQPATQVGQMDEAQGLLLSRHHFLFSVVGKNSKSCLI